MKHFTHFLAALGKLRKTFGEVDLSNLPMPPPSQDSAHCEAPLQSVLEPVKMPVTDKPVVKSSIVCKEGEMSQGRGKCEDKSFTNFYGLKAHIIKYHKDTDAEALFRKNDKGLMVADDVKYRGMQEASQATVLCRWVQQTPC